MQPRVQLGVEIQKRLRPRLAVQQFVRRFVRPPFVPPLVGLGTDVLRLQGFDHIEHTVVDDRIMVGMRHVALAGPAFLSQLGMVADGQPPIGMAADLPGRTKVYKMVVAELPEAAQVAE